MQIAQQMVVANIHYSGQKSFLLQNAQPAEYHSGVLQDIFFQGLGRGSPTCCPLMWGGVGAGVGGEAGAEGRRGFGMACGMDGGIPVFGVRGDLGCECRIDSFRRVECLTETGVG